MLPPKALLSCTLALLLCALAAEAQQALSPPWWVTYDLVSAALRSDRCLNVSALEQVAVLPAATFRFNITVCSKASEDKVAGVATFLTFEINYGGTLFRSRVLDSKGRHVKPALVKDGEHAMRLAGAALKGNRYFERTATSSPFPCINFYWVVFKPEIIQVWIDNMADLYGNINLLAADLFGRVFQLEAYGVRPATLKFKAPDDLKEERGAAAPAASDGGLPAATAAAAAAAEKEAHQRLPQLLGLPGEEATSSRRQLAGASAGSSWQQATLCWALRLARWLGGDPLVLSAHRLICTMRLSMHC